MPTCCIENICRVICDATFEPVIICDDWRPLACNHRLLEVFSYSSEDEVISQPIRAFINRHFTPKEVQTNGTHRQVHIMELTYALVSHSDMSEKMAIVKVKRWEFENRPYYTISIRDVHILKLLKKDPSPLDNTPINTSMDFDPIDEPHLESRLLREFSLLADAIPVMVWICGREGEIYYANKRVKETWGIDVLAETWQECLHPEDWEAFIPAWNDASKHVKGFTMEFRYRNKNDLPKADASYNWRWHIFHSIPTFDNKNLKRWVLTAVDVHDWKCAEAEKQRLIASEKMATEASRLKSAFLSTMSHEIRTPLFGIVGNTCLLSETNITSEQRGFLNAIDGSAHLMMNVIQDILDFSRIEAGKLSIILAPFSLKRLMNRVSRMIKTASDKKKLGFNITLSEEDSIVIGDEQRIQQILINLASNAVKFTHEGQISLKSTAVSLDSGRISIRITVQDTGIGMCPEVIAKLFTPWTQADSSNRRLYGGSGLGLAISKALADMMGGSISLTSEVGKGSIFWIELTLEKSNELHLEEIPSSPDSPMKNQKFEFYGFREPIQSPNNYIENPIPLSESPTAKRKTFKSLKGMKKENPPRKQLKTSSDPLNSLPSDRKFQVLLAEDNPINQAILVRFLEKMRCIKIELASDGVQALNAYNARPAGYFDIILLDQSMPKMDGDMVCRAIRQEDSDQIIISVSANTLLSDRTYFLEVGMNDHISKPVTFVNFRATVTQWLLTRAESETPNNPETT